MKVSGGKGRRGKVLGPIVMPRVEDAQTTEQPAVFKLQLRPLEDPEGFKPSVQLVSREFATRYLESVGVRPSKAAMELVHRNVPLTDAHIKTTLRAKGHVEDEIHISVPPILHHFRPPVVINPAAVLQLGIGNSVLLGVSDGLDEAEGGQANGSASSPSALSRAGADQRPGSRNTDASGVSLSKAPGGADFLDMAARYLHPFKLDLSLARQNLSELYSAARRKSQESDDMAVNSTSTLGGAGGSLGPSASGRMSGLAPAGEGTRGTLSSLGSVAAGNSRRSGSWPRSNSGHMQGPGQQQQASSGGGGGSGGGSVSGRVAALYDEATRLEVLEELVQPLLVTPEVVLTLQAQLEAALMDWHRHQAPEALKGRLTKEEFVRALEELTGEGMVKLLITVINFLHEELIRGHPTYPAQHEARRASRDGGRSNHGHSQDALMGERSSFPHGSSIGGDGASSVASSRRSYGGSGSARGSVQLPANISIQQMTSLQKHDLGYQAYVRQKLEQRQMQGCSAGGSRQGRGGSAAHEVRSPGASAGGNRSRTQSAQQQQRTRPPSPQGPQPDQQPASSSANAPDTQRVSFAAVPHYSSPNTPLPGSRPGSRPESPALRTPSSAPLGPLNLPGSRSRPPSSGVGVIANNGNNTNRGLVSATAGASVDFILDSSPIPGLPPRVGRALRHSPSFALASAANTARSIHASLNAEDMAALQRERLFALHIDFASRFKALRQSRSGMFFTLPILFLSMRLCVNMLFSTLYPLWTRLPEGAAVLEEMDAALCALFDPHGYLERALSMLQSTPSAIEAVMRHPQRRGNERQHFNDTSPLLQATLQGAKSAGARKLMQSATNRPQGLALMRTQLTTEQRAALFQLGLQWMQQPDPVLSQVGEPHAVGRL